MGGYIIKGNFIYDEDMVNLVLQNINYGSVWKNIRSVSKNIYLLSRKYQESKLIELANPILSLFYIYSEKRWNLLHLFTLGIITIDFIRLTHDKIPWFKDIISMSTGITIEDIINSDPDSICWFYISRNPSIRVSDMLKYDYLPWNYKGASRNISIRIEDIRDNLNKDWDYYELVINKSLSIEDLSTVLDLSRSNKWWMTNENATYKDIVKYIGIYPDDITIYKIIKYILLDEDILQEYINRNRAIEAGDIYKQSITPNIIRNNPQLNWDHFRIDYTKFTIEEMMNISGTFDISILLNHPDFTMEHFFKYFDIDTFAGWWYLSKSPWLTFDIVLKYKDSIFWDHQGLSMNPNVTVDILEDNNFSWIEWNYSELSRYAQLNWVYIIRNVNKGWDFMALLFNKSQVNFYII